MRNHYETNKTVVEFSELSGKTLQSISGGVGDEEIEFITKEGEKYTLRYYDDCCAQCSVEDICGDLSDLIGSPILLAEETLSNDNPPGVTPPEEYQYSFTWTFYKLATTNGSVTIRWYGSSNGCYSETATLERWSIL